MLGFKAPLVLEISNCLSSVSGETYSTLKRMKEVEFTTGLTSQSLLCIKWSQRKDQIALENWLIESFHPMEGQHTLEDLAKLWRLYLVILFLNFSMVTGVLTWEDCGLLCLQNPSCLVWNWRIDRYYLANNQVTAHCKENPIYVFPGKKLRCLSSNFHNHVFVWAFYKFPPSVHLFSCSRIGRPLVGKYKLLTEIWM